MASRYPTINSICGPSSPEDEIKKTEGAKELRRKAEEKVASQPVPAGDTDLKRLLHKLRIQNFELRAQNEELQRATQAVQVHMTHMQNVINMTPAGYFRLDKDDCFVEVNDAWLIMHGYDSRDEIIGKHFSILQVDSTSDSALKHLEELHSGKPIPLGDFSSLRKDGTVLHHVFSAHPVMETGRVICFEWFIIDITKRKKAEEMRNSLNAQLDKQNKELEQVIYVTCHDLRSPLVTIEGFSDVLETSVEEILTVLEHEGLSDATKARLAASVIDSRESRGYIRKSVAKMIILLKGLSQVSRLGRVEIYKEELDMNQLISGILAENEFQRKEQRVKIELSDLPSCLGDPGQISPLFANLIDNALKYSTPDRPCMIKISGQKEADHSVYCVEDNGIGIALEHQHKVFEMFHQLDPEMAGEGQDSISQVKL